MVTIAITTLMAACGFSAVAGVIAMGYVAQRYPETLGLMRRRT